MPTDEQGRLVTVVVPTLRRPASLERCLAGLAAQDARPAQVLVVHREDDRASAGVASKNRLTDPVVVREPGVVAAMAAGARAATGGVIAYCDDDAVPRADWVRRISAAFAAPDLGAFGGLDHLAPPHPDYPPTNEVGRIGAWGRMVGDHHRGRGKARDVEVLKAVNMAFRRQALAFPSGLRGDGAQVHFEVAMCLWALASGWRVRYEPEMVVDHDPEQRLGADRRGRPAASAVFDGAYNLNVAMLTFRPDMRWRRLAYGLGMGDRGAPGLGRAAVAVVQRDRETVRRLVPSLHGQVAGACAASRRGGLKLLPIGAPDQGSSS